MVRLSFRVVLGAILVFLGIAAVSYMQKRFDASDEKRALQAVVGRVADIGDASACRTEVVSRVKGEIRVICGNRSWLVSVLSAQIAPEKSPEKSEDNQ
jgi:hypothetical protein